MLTLNEPVISKLNELMQKQNLDLNQLSLKTNIPCRKLTRYFAGKEVIKSITPLGKICQALGIPVSELFKPNISIPELNAEEKRLLSYYKSLPSDKQEVFLAFLKGCKCRFF